MGFTGLNFIGVCPKFSTLEGWILFPVSHYSYLMYIEEEWEMLDKKHIQPLNWMEKSKITFFNVLESEFTSRHIYVLASLYIVFILSTPQIAHKFWTTLFTVLLVYI